MRILITGSRNWTSRRAIAAVIRLAIQSTPLRDVTIVHGGARGADAIAGEYALGLGVTVEEYPAKWDKYGPAAGPIRNEWMVCLGADLCLAFPLGESRGTRDCMRRAERVGIPVHNFGEEE